MRLHKPLALVVTLTFSQPALADPTSWSLSQSVDPITDENMAAATGVYVEDGLRRVVTIRCIGKRLDTFIGFGEFINNTVLIPLIYRIDKQDPVKVQWLLSSDGAAVSPLYNHDVARQLMNGSTFVIEASDYRSVSHRLIFDLVGGHDVIPKVLDQCGASRVGLDVAIPGLSHEIANEIEQWGPKHIAVAKDVLISLHYYSGPADTIEEPTFMIAVQRFWDDTYSRCKSGELHLVECEGTTDPFAFIYERATGKLKDVAGDLSGRD